MNEPKENAGSAASLNGNFEERRVNLRLRQIFDDAVELVAPFFDSNNSWGGHSLEHFAFRVLREHYPDLSSGEVHVFVSAAKQVYAKRASEAASAK